MKITNFLNEKRNLKCTMTIRNLFVKAPETKSQFDPKGQNFTALNKRI